MSSNKVASVPLAEMIAAAGAEAHRIEGSQRALIASGDRAFPDAGQMRRASVFWEIEDLLKIFQANEAELRAAIRRLPHNG